MLIPLKIGDAFQDRMHLLGASDKHLAPGVTITVRARAADSPQLSLVVDVVERFGDGRLKLVKASAVQAGRGQRLQTNAPPVR
jgi:hypothetical protein